MGDGVLGFLRPRRKKLVLDGTGGELAAVPAVPAVVVGYSCSPKLASDRDDSEARLGGSDKAMPS